MLPVYPFIVHNHSPFDSVMRSFESQQHRDDYQSEYAKYDPELDRFKSHAVRKAQYMAGREWVSSTERYQQTDL